MINFDDFIKTDLRVARIVEAEDVIDAVATVGSSEAPTVTLSNSFSSISLRQR